MSTPSEKAAPILEVEEKSIAIKFTRSRSLPRLNSLSFGSHLRQHLGSGRRSGDSGSSFFSEFPSDGETWDDSQPCSSSQAAGRDQYLNYLDTGYVSNAPTKPVKPSVALLNIPASIQEKDVAVKELRTEDRREKSFLVTAGKPVIRNFIKDLDVFYNYEYYGHILVDMTAHMQPCETPRQRQGAVGKILKKSMPLLFGKSHKSPADVVKNLREALIAVDKVPVELIDPKEKKQEKALEEVSKNVAMIKSFIYGSDSSEPTNEHVVQVAQLAQEVYNANVLPMLIKLLPRFEFECKKDVGQIFNNLLRRQIGTRSPTVEYLGARPEILVQLVQGYSYKDIALTCGNMLRESIRHDHLAKIILYSDVFYTFFTYVQSEVFDIASDAFATFKDLTTRHKAISAEFLDSNYDKFFGEYQKLLNSTNYVTRRQSLKLLGELLLDRHNFNIMTKYISNPDNLKLMMELLRDKSRNIQYEAFHVFKVFVANPNKPKPISDILNRNRDKLVEFLGEFQNDRTDDEQFNDEKAYLIKQIQEMKSAPKEPKKKKEGDHQSTSGSPSEN